MNGTVSSSRLEGMCVNTMVFTRPMRRRQPGRREVRQGIGDACHEKQQSDGFDADPETLIEEIGEQRRREETAADGVDGEQRADPASGRGARRA